MNRFTHWFAASLFITVVTAMLAAFMALLAWLGYFVVTEFPMFIVIIGACGLFIGSTYWAESYIREHGWPWKRKHQSEEVNRG